MSDQKALTWWESPRDLAVLAETRFNLNLAFEIATSNGSSKPNTVFRSQRPEPQVRIQWRPAYALSFTQDLPPLDSIVYLSTPWQACGKGEAYDLSTSGFFSKASSLPGAGAGALSVVNKYPISLHFVVGMYSEDSGRYEPVFVDPRRVEPGQSASYRPTGRALWWLDRPLVSGSFFDGGRNKGVVCSGDFEQAAELTTNFDLAEGAWRMEN